MGKNSHARNGLLEKEADDFDEVEDLEVSFVYLPAYYTLQANQQKQLSSARNEELHMEEEPEAQSIAERLDPKQPIADHSASPSGVRIFLIGLLGEHEIFALP